MKLFRRLKRLRPSNAKKNRLSLQIEELESRLTPTGGTWTAVANGSGGGTMLLLSDGTVMIQGGGISNSWSRLTPTSTGSYASGTFSSLASMNVSRLYYASSVLPDGRVFVYGGEYTNGAQNDANSGEIYNPVTNAWTAVASIPWVSAFGDDPSAVLPNGTVLAGYLSGPQTFIYNPTTNSWATTGTKLRNDESSEESWVKLPDGSILSYDVFSSISTGTNHAQRYVPSSGTWVDAGSFPAPLLTSSGVGYELGPAVLLPDGRVFQIGATSNTALYTPSTNTWAAGPTIPNGQGADDAPAAVLPNGDVLFAADTPLYNGPTQLFEFDPVANTITQLTLPSGLSSDLSGACYLTRMLVLPSGQVLLSTTSNQLWLFTPNGSPQAAWEPTVSSVANNGDGTYTLTGTQLNGLSEGTAYGDDAEMSSNYPIVRLVSGSGQVYYARTFNWSSTSVATGSAAVSTEFTLPAGLPNGTYSLYAIANGIASTPISFMPAADQPPTVVNPASATPNVVTGTSTSLSVLGGDSDTGESSLTYTWTVASQPASAPTPTFTFSSGINNGTNGARNATATFYAAGSYTLQATITDPSGLTAASSVTVTVTQKETRVSVSPASVSVPAGSTQQFAATALDQFGRAMTSQPTFIWTVDAGGSGGSIAAGLYTAPNLAVKGADTVLATDSSIGLSGTAAVTVVVLPAAPTNLVATGVSPSQINLTWTDNATNETSYGVERSSNGNNWSVIATLAANSTGYTDNSNFRSGATYTYRVRDFNGTVASPYSNTASAVATYAAPAAPSNLVATAVSSSQINLSWTNHASNATAYEVMRSTTGTGGWTVLVSNLPATATSYSDTRKLNSGTTYYYQVLAINHTTLSSPSNVANATLPAKPKPPGSKLPGTALVSHGPSAGQVSPPASPQLPSSTGTNTQAKNGEPTARNGSDPDHGGHLVSPGTSAATWVDALDALLLAELDRLFAANSTH